MEKTFELDPDRLEPVSGGADVPLECPYCHNPWAMDPSSDGVRCYYCKAILIPNGNGGNIVPDPVPSPSPAPVPLD